MANLDTPKGFEVYGECKRIGIYQSGSACYPGDLLNLASDGQVDPAAAGGIILGVCLSYASGAGEDVQVADHPDQLIVGQCDGSDVDAQTDIGNMCDHLATAGSSSYKASRHEIDSSTIAATAAGLQILRVEPVVGNALGAQVKVVCRINEHALAHATGQAGV